jgi:dynein heavy chain 1
MDGSTALTNGTSVNGDHPSQEPASTFDPDIFRQYLLTLLPPVLGANPADLNSLFDSEFADRISRFAADTGGVIYVVQAKQEHEGNTTLQESFRAHTCC